jgi:hypothetical protein
MSGRPILTCTVTIMAADEALEVLRELVAGAVRAPEEESPRGAGPEELASLPARLGCGIPPILHAWLSVCRGAGIGPGGVFGQRPGTPFTDMAWRRDLFPEWAELGWLPVAGDGCGNCYVLTGDGTIGFVDTTRCGLRPGRRGRVLVIRYPGPAAGPPSRLTASPFGLCEGPSSLGMPRR